MSTTAGSPLPAALRAALAARAAWGLALTAAPARSAALACGSHARPPAWLVRVLGVRLLAESIGVLRFPSRGSVLTAAAVEALHAASMAAVAALSPAYRRAAVVSGVPSAVTAVTDAVTAPRSGR